VCGDTMVVDAMLLVEYSSVVLKSMYKLKAATIEPRKRK
jgi:hypothetical protein